MRLAVTIALLALLTAACNATDLAEGIANQALEEEGVSVDLDDDGSVSIDTPEGEVNAEVGEDGVTIEGPDGTTTIEGDESGEFSIEGPDGSITSGGEGAVPADFPEAFPLPGDAQAVNVIRSENPEGLAFIFQFSVGGSQADTAAFYDSELAGRGFNITSQFSSAEAANYTFEGNGLAGTVAITSNTGQTEVAGQVTVQQ